MKPEDKAIDALSKWRLILGTNADTAEEVVLTEQWLKIDQTLEALYDSEKRGGLGKSSPNINRWLGDIRAYFPLSIVKVLQQDALQRLNLKQLLLEPELLEQLPPDPELVATLLHLKNVMPDETKQSARQLIERVVQELRKKLRTPMLSTLSGTLHRASKTTRPKLKEIDWPKTIQKNLKHYQAKYQTIIPEKLIGYSRKNKTLRQVVLLVDQSGSMASSFVYSCVFAAIMASLPSLKTHLVLFDTAIADMSDHLNDPVDILFGGQLGGGTDINKALAYADGLIQHPPNAVLVLISDLFEGGNKKEMLNALYTIKEKGTNCICLLSLNDEGSPSYDHEMSAQIAAMKIPVFACSPDHFPGLMSKAVNREDMHAWMGKQGISPKG